MQRGTAGSTMAGSQGKPRTMQQLSETFCARSHSGARTSLQRSQEATAHCRHEHPRARRNAAPERPISNQLRRAGREFGAGEFSARLQRREGSATARAKVRVLLHLRPPVHRRLAADTRAAVSAEVGRAEQQTAKVGKTTSAYETGVLDWRRRQ